MDQKRIGVSLNRRVKIELAKTLEIEIPENDAVVAVDSTDKGNK